MITRTILLGTAIAGLAGCVTNPSPVCQCAKAPRVYCEILPGEGLKVPDSTTTEMKPGVIEWQKMHPGSEFGDLVYRVEPQLVIPEYSLNSVVTLAPSMYEYDPDYEQVAIVPLENGGGALFRNKITGVVVHEIRTPKGIPSTVYVQ